MAEHKNHIPFIITLLVIGWGLLIVVNVLRAGWSGPSAAPPDGNPSSFLTSGSNPETKSGPLTISNNFYVTDNVNLGSTSTPTSARLVINPQSNASIDAGNGFIRTTYIPNYDYDVVTKNYLVSSLGASSYWILSGNSLYPTSTVEKVVIGTDPNNTNDSGFEYGNGYNPSMSNYNNLRFRVNSFFESPFVSMGIAQNFLLRSEAFDHTSWVKTDIGSTVSADGITAPNGKVTAENIPAGTTSTANIAQTITNSSTVTPWSAGVWARAQSGTTTMKLRLDSTSATGTEVAFNLDTNWRFYSITQEFTSSHTTKTFRIINGTSAISLWGARMNPGPTVNAYYYTTSSGLTSPYNGVFFNYSNVYASTFSGSLSGNASSANYASGLYGGFTQSNSIDKTNQWEYIGYIYLYYSSTYRYGQSWNVELKIKELDRIGALTPDNYGETTVRLQGKMPSVVNGTEFNTTTPTFTLDIANSKGSLGPNDLAMLVYSSNTSAKYIRLYVKLKSSDSHYVIVPINQYGSSYNSSGGISTSYCYYVSVGSQTSVASLPTPAQGSVVYATQRFDNSDFWRSNNNDIYNTNTGNVGIGTTTPSTALHIYPHTNTEGLRIVSSNYSPLVIRDSTDWNDLFRVNQSGDVTAVTSSATRMRSNNYCDANGDNCFNPSGGWNSVSYFATVTSSTYSGNNNGHPGYTYAHDRCNDQLAGSHVCSAEEILNTIRDNKPLPSVDVWIFNGPPGYTAAANDCEARSTNLGSSKYGAYWQASTTDNLKGRGLLAYCNSSLKLACCH